MPSIGVGSDRATTGYEAMPLERLTLLAASGPGGSPRRPAPERGAGGGHTSAARHQHVDETDDPYARGRRAGRGHVAVSDTMLAMHVLRLQATLGTATRFGLASDVLRALRMIKDPDEITLLRLAAQAADRVVAQIAAGRLVGRTEADVAREVRERACRRRP
jgi:Xaa-Pro aminopeptidase